ncbi:Phenoloxidase subunit 1 [Gryllus bimaculatus]|nr:Phenoloxidase subunit 1 [Gryllus bimaculatus]
MVAFFPFFPVGPSRAGMAQGVRCKRHRSLAAAVHQRARQTLIIDSDTSAGGALSRCGAAIPRPRLGPPRSVPRLPPRLAAATTNPMPPPVSPYVPRTARSARPLGPAPLGPAPLGPAPARPRPARPGPARPRPRSVPHRPILPHPPHPPHPTSPQFPPYAAPCLVPPLARPRPLAHPTRSIPPGRCPFPPLIPSAVEPAPPWRNRSSGSPLTTLDPPRSTLDLHSSRCNIEIGKALRDSKTGMRLICTRMLVATVISKLSIRAQAGHQIDNTTLHSAVPSIPITERNINSNIRRAPGPRVAGGVVGAYRGGSGGGDEGRKWAAAEFGVGDMKNERITGNGYGESDDSNDGYNGGVLYTHGNLLASGSVAAGPITVTMKILLTILLLAVAAAQQESRFNLKTHLQLMFDRPAEPLFVLKGQRRDFQFDIPEEFVNTRFKKTQRKIQKQAGANILKIKKLDVLPDISFPKQLGRREQFSHFVPKHRQMTKQLVQMLMNSSDVESFLSTSAYCRDQINPFMYSYALAVAIQHRRDTMGLTLPHVPSFFPERFFDGSVFSKVRNEVFHAAAEDRDVIAIPRDFTASDLEPEHRVAYFREDIGVNLHHWNWHVYNFDRLSNNLARVQRLLNWRKPIEEGYFPKLNAIIATRVWQPRPANSVLKLSDISRDDMQLDFDILDLERWRDRIYAAISSGKVLAENNTYVPLDDYTGIDILGNMIERSDISINSNLYGDLHGLGHVAIALVHDPDHKHLEQAGVMGAVETAMRDPVFYRWHSFINDMFVAHKQTLQPYTEQELGFRNVQVVRADVETQYLDVLNEFSTFWKEDDFNVDRGLDFMGNGTVRVRITHLTHTPFRYLIQVNNAGPPRIGTVRIFMAPHFDERGIQLTLRDQRQHFIEMDKFQVRLQTGPNQIERLSRLSSVTIPRENTFRDPAQELNTDAGEMCTCGWPQHMLVPRGKVKGLPADLFVMVSDGAGDQVRDPQGPPNTCTDAHSLCGIRNRMYPDRRPMGYPFDRLPRAGVTTLPEFLLPNMMVTPVVIRHTDGFAPASPPTPTRFLPLQA